MSLSSKKSSECYNRASRKIQALELIEEATAYNPYDYEPDPCNCGDCNPPLSELYRNRLVNFLHKLRAVNDAMAHSFYFDYW